MHVCACARSLAQGTSYKNIRALHKYVHLAAFGISLRPTSLKHGGLQMLYNNNKRLLPKSVQNPIKAISHHDMQQTKCLLHTGPLTYASLCELLALGRSCTSCMYIIKLSTCNAMH